MKKPGRKKRPKRPAATWSNHVSECLHFTSISADGPQPPLSTNDPTKNSPQGRQHRRAICSCRLLLLHRKRQSVTRSNTEHATQQHRDCRHMRNRSVHCVFPKLSRTSKMSARVPSDGCALAASVAIHAETVLDRTQFERVCTQQNANVNTCQVSKRSKALVSQAMAHHCK